MSDGGISGAEWPLAKGLQVIAVLPRTWLVVTGFLKAGFLETGSRASELLVTQQQIRRK